MKRIKNLAVSTALSVIMAFSLVPVQGFLGCEVVSQASQIKISKKAISLKIGQKTKLRVSGTSKKVKWSSSDKSIVSVDKSGNVTAISVGTARIDAKVGGKTYTCTVTVKFDANKAKKGISTELKDTGTGVVAIIKNNNNYTLSIRATLAYLKGGAMIDSDSETNYALESGRSCALFFNCPTDSNYRKTEYDDYKMSINAEPASSDVVACASGVSIKSNLGENSITVEATNNSKITYSYVTATCIMYDSSSHAIGYDWHYVECDNPGDTEYFKFDFPHDSDYNSIAPASYEIYINSAYTYHWNL